MKKFRIFSIRNFFISACQKSLWLFCTLQKRHIFCENRFSRKISLRSSKSLINQAFLMAINPISSGAFAPSSSPAALLSFFCSIVFRQPGIYISGSPVRGCRRNRDVSLPVMLRYISAKFACMIEKSAEYELTWKSLPGSYRYCKGHGHLVYSYP